MGDIPGPKSEATGNRNQLECIQLFLTSDIYDELLTQSYLYAEQQRTSKMIIVLGSPITKEELIAFIGVIVTMGVVQLPSADNYWSIDPILAHPWFRTVFTCFHFQ